MRKIIGLILSGICMIAIVMITTMSGYLANPEHKLFRLLVEPINLASLAGLGFFIYLFWWFSYGVVLYLVTLLTLKIIFLTFLGLRIIYIKRANFKSIGSLVLITCFFVRQNRFGALIQTFSQKTAKNQISGRFPPLPSTRYVLDILLFTSA